MKRFPIIKENKYTNKLLLIIFLIINIILLTSVIFFSRAQLLWYLIYVNIFINFLTVAIYLYLNEKRRIEFNNLMIIFKNIIEDKEIYSIPKNALYSENKEISSLIKRSYIKWNLQKKDLVDLNSVFEKFVPKDIYKQIWYRWSEKISLWNWIIKNVTIMFLDIMWFTKISETMTPDRALFLLNIYFDWIGEIIYEHWWYIDKFLWDWIMVLFEHVNSDKAISCALNIQEFIKRFQMSNIWKYLNIWIWINSWEVIMWTVWTKQRMDATVIWDNVNIASRLEWLTRKYDKKIIIGQNTYDIIDNKEIFTINHIWEQKLSWKKQKIKIYSIEIPEI